MRDCDIPDNYDLFKRHEAAQEAKLARRPICIRCGQHIQDDFAYDFGDDSNGSVCDDCILDYVRANYSYTIED